MSSKKKAVNLTLSPKVIELAEDVMELRGHTSLSVFVEELIRDEYEKRQGAMRFPERTIAAAVLNEPSSALALKHAESSVAAAESALRHDPESQPLPEVDAPSARKSSPSRDTSTHPKAAPKAPKQAPE